MVGVGPRTSSMTSSSASPSPRPAAANVRTAGPCPRPAHLPPSGVASVTAPWSRRLLALAALAPVLLTSVAAAAPADAAARPLQRAHLLAAASTVSATSASALPAASYALGAGKSGSSLSGTASTSSDVTTTLTVDKVATGGGIYLSVLGRHVASAGAYAAKVHVAATGAVDLGLMRRDAASAEHVVAAPKVVTGVTLTAAKALHVRVVTTGAFPTTVRAKVWQAGTTEPSAWTTSGTDATSTLQKAGVVGSFAYLSGSATNAPVVAAFTSGTGSTGGTGTTGAEPEVEGPTTARKASAAGAARVGTTSYAAPSGARYVSPSGSDSAAGTATAPFRTVAKAISASASGSTIVLRGGSYAESVTVPATKKLTIQSAAGEAVWFEGSKATSGWTADGGDWRLSGWTASFDHSPTYTPGAPDNTEPGWSFVNASYPRAAYPEQLYVDGVAQQQVAGRDAVVPGTFYADRSNDRLVMGTDPTGREVRTSASNLELAITINSAGSVLRGIGVRRYATSLPLMGTVRVLANSVVLEDVHVSDNATQGVFVRGTGVQLRRVSVERNGLNGITATFSDNLRAEGVRAHGNNTERFNSSPVAGGVKVGRSRGITVVNSSFQGNRGTGLWFDESVYNVIATGNDVIDNTSNGISFEISSKAVFADNLIVRSGSTGLKINNAQYVSIWNNTIVDTKGRPIWLVQDSRLASNLSEPGHDKRQVLPDPTVTWRLGPVTVRNNVIARSGTNCLLCTQDTALKRSAETIGITANGNVYNRPSTSSPTWPVIWASGLTNPHVYTSISAFRSAKRQEGTGAEYTGANVLDSAFRPGSTLKAAEAGIAQPLDATIATLTGRTAGERRVGAWLS